VAQPTVNKTDLAKQNTYKIACCDGSRNPRVSRDYHYLVCKLDIQQDSEFATGCGYPKTAFKREPDKQGWH